MYDYAIIIHPTNEELLYRYEPGMKSKPRPLVKKVLEWMPPFVAAEVEDVKSPLGVTAKGALVMCPLLLEQMVTLSPSKVMMSVVQAAQFAREKLNPKIIGLTAYAAFSGNKGTELAKTFNSPLTVGASYSLAMVTESILKAAEMMKLNLESASMLLIGATTSVGKYCVKELSPFLSGIFVTTHNEGKLSLLLAQLPKEIGSKIHRLQDIDALLERVNIVVIASNRIPSGLDLRKLKPGAIIFDASYPRHITSKLRDDILVIDGVSVKPFGNVNFNFDFGLPAGLCYPCMAEPMILALEKKFENYSIGKDFDISKVKEIVSLGKKHGFGIASLTTHSAVISDEEIDRIRHNAYENIVKYYPMDNIVKLAFIIHPPSIRQVKNTWPITKFIPGFILKAFLKRISPFKISPPRKIRSILGREVEAHFIIFPLLSEQIYQMEEEEVFNRGIAAGRIAEHLGVGLIGLTGYTSLAGDKGNAFAKHMKVSVTTGTAFTAWSVFEAVYRTAKVKNLDMKESTIAVIGATGAIGSLCCRKLSGYAGKMIITARCQDKLEQLKEKILQLNPIEVIIERDVRKAVKDADIVITATSTPQILFDIEEMKAGSIACDVSLPGNISHKQKSSKKVSYIEGGLIKLPYPVDFGIDTGLPKNIAYASFVETLVLAFENKFASYSLGDNINLDKLEEIADIAVKHGFEVWVPGAPVL